MVKCLECNTQFENDEGLHRHLRAHRLVMSSYYYKYFPRHDKHDGQPIKFRDKESYFYTDFNSKENLKAWLDKVDVEEAKLYIKSYFFARKERKNLKFAPTQVELRSLPIPGMKYLTQLFGSYKNLCDSVSLPIRHQQVKFELPPCDISKHTIYVDTREQTPLTFNLRTETQTFTFADYRLSDNEVTGHCYIERKNVNDFYGTLGKALERFKRELTKARSAGAYVIVVVEGRFEDVYNFSSGKFLNKPRNWEQRTEKPVISSPNHVFHGMREVMEEFDDVQFLFVKDRAEASRVIEKIFSSNGEYKKVDLQYSYDLGHL